MEELSIEQKAELYDEAIEKARIWKDKSGMPKDKQGILDDIFPELAESEDERIRQKLIHLVRKSYEYGGYSLHKDEADMMTDWIEKQEQKTTDEEIKELLRTEYEKGRADVIQATEQWLANSWPKYCDNPNIIKAFEENVIKD